MDALPNPTIYVQNLYEKLPKQGVEEEVWPVFDQSSCVWQCNAL